MKKILCCLILIFTLVTGNVYAKPVINSGACILIDAETGEILYSKNAEERMFPASITKVLTVYLACLHGNEKDVVTASKSAIDIVPKDTSNIALDYDEKITLEDAMCSAMLMSANDSANVIAEYISGSVEDFAILMNKTANEIGIKNSNFVNANGLYDEEHYTTAHDFALITKKALENEKFRKYFSMLEYTIPDTNKKDEPRNMVTQHRMMHWPQYADLGVIGGKSGYTSQSLYTLVTYGESNGQKLIAVVLKSKTFTDVYQDTKALLEYGYNEFIKVTVSSDGIEPFVDGRTTLTPKGEVSFNLLNEYSVEDLKKVYKDDKLYLTLNDGTVVAEMETEKHTEPLLIVKILKVIGIVLGILIVLSIAICSYIVHEHNKKKKLRDEKKKLLYK